MLVVSMVTLEFLLKFVPQGLSQVIELHTNEIIMDISIDKHTLLWILLEAIIMLGLWNSRGHTT